jgi:NADPH-dependent 7-cyano-7-deazaguanine reductase QueF
LQIKRILENFRHKNISVEEFFEEIFREAMRASLATDSEEEIMKFVDGIKLSKKRR